MRKKDTLWLANPVKELRKHPDGTLIVMQTNVGKRYMGVLSGGQQGDESKMLLRFRNRKLVEIEEHIKRGSRFALLKR